jgi:hypothetical protein
MDKFQRELLDSYITGHCGEDSVPVTTSAFEEGQDACASGENKKANPYELGSTDYWEWSRGWDDEWVWKNLLKGGENGYLA